MINPIQLKSTNTASILENDLSNSLKSRNDTNLDKLGTLVYIQFIETDETPVLSHLMSFQVAQQQHYLLWQTEIGLKN